MEIIEKTRLNDGRLISLVSDSSFRNFNVSIFSVSSNNPEKEYSFPNMIKETRARKEYKKLTEEYN